MLVNFKKDSLLFREGDPSTGIYRLISGDAVVSKLVVDASTSIGLVAPGEFIGEIGTLLGCPRNATVQFATDAVLERMTRAEFLDLVMEEGDLGMRFLHALSLRTGSLVEQLGQFTHLAEFRTVAPQGVLVKALRLLWHFLPMPMDLLRRSMKFFPRELLAAGGRLAALPPNTEAQTVRMARGETLFREGEPSVCVYFISSGTVEVLRHIDDETRPIARLRAGEFVGEMDVLESRLRSATVVAATAVELKRLEPQTFEALMQQSKAAYFRVMDSLCERNQQLSRLIVELHHVVATDSGEGVSPLAETLCSMESLAQLAEQRFVNELIKTRQFFHVQADHGREMLRIYHKYARGEATKDEMERANAHFRDYLRIAGIGTLMLLPGAVLTIPLVVKMGKAIGVDVLPHGDPTPPRSRPHDRVG